MLQRTIQKIVRMNAQEPQSKKKCANKCGLSEEAYLRSLLNGLVPKEIPSIDYQGMMRELNARVSPLLLMPILVNKAG